MKFHEMVFTIRMDHAVIGTLLASIERSNDRDARKKLSIVKLLLINHFLVEEFVLYPYIRKKVISDEMHGRIRLFDQMEDHDAAEWMQEMDRHHAACTAIIALVSDCLRAEEGRFQEMFARIAALLRERITFEELHLLKGVDTSKTKLLRKADFARVRIDD